MYYNPFFSKLKKRRGMHTTLTYLFDLLGYFFPEADAAFRILG